MVLQLLPLSPKALKDYLVAVLYEDERINEIQSIENEALKRKAFFTLILTEINVTNREQLLTLKFQPLFYCVI